MYECACIAEFLFTICQSSHLVGNKGSMENSSSMEASSAFDDDKLKGAVGRVTPNLNYHCSIMPKQLL